ncbi:MAG: hypothetical protein L3J32_02900 [Rhizobiaceae bacterium]|nr:hypothetical protein [Rhizobiaceae bacterium]
MRYWLPKKILVIFALLFTTACASTGIIPLDMELDVNNVVVTQSEGVEAGNRFSHELREEVRYEFSRAELGTKQARIYLEVNELSFRDLSKRGLKQGENRLVSYGRLIDAITGDSMGEFPLTVVSNENASDSVSSFDRENIRSDLIALMARATLDKIYGKKRAAKIVENPALHEREPYLVKMSGPVQLRAATGEELQSVPVIIDDEFSEEVISDVVDQRRNMLQNPKVITAPELPVQ